MISKITDLDNLKGIRISTNAFFIKNYILQEKILNTYTRMLLQSQIKVKTQSNHIKA